MYAKYTYKAGSSLANIVNDMVLLCTGTTDVNLLSADCDKPLSSVSTLYNPAGWSIHDANAGLHTKTAAVAATTTNITLSGLQTIDGVSIVATNRVLVKTQTLPAENGIYVAASGAWTRATDMDAFSEFPGAYVPITGGTTLAGTNWLCTNAPGGTLGTTAITWIQFLGAALPEQVIKAPIFDNPSRFKYVNIDTNSDANILKLVIWDQWNAGTHTGTTQVTQSAASVTGNTIDTTNGGYILIAATARYLITKSIKNIGGEGTSTVNQAPNCIEFSRFFGWDTAVADYPNFGLIQLTGATSAIGAYYPRGFNAVSQAAINTQIIMVPYNTASDSSILINQTTNSSGQQTHLLAPIYLRQNTNGNYGAESATVSQVYCTTSSFGATEDEINVGGFTYVVFRVIISGTLAVKKG